MFGNSKKPCLLPTITLRFTCSGQKFGQTSKSLKILWPDCKLHLITNKFQYQTNGKTKKTQGNKKQLNIQKKKKKKISKQITTTKPYSQFKIILMNTERNRNIPTILSKTTIWAKFTFFEHFRLWNCNTLRWFVNVVRYQIS